MQEKLQKITLEEAISLMGQIGPDVAEELSLGATDSVLCVTNDMDEDGYMLPLDDPNVKYFRVPDDTIIVIETPAGSSKKAPYGTRFTFDGLGWSDTTEYPYDSVAWHAVADDLGNASIVPKVKAFIAMLPDDVRVKIDVSMGMGSISISCHDACLERMIRNSKQNDELCMAIHSNPFISFCTPEADYGNGEIFLGPPPNDIRLRNKMPNASIEEQGVALLTQAARAI